jgi:hypothetical protein
MRLVYIHGPAASGKLTVGRELQKLSGFALFHNHLVVDTLSPARSICEFFDLPILAEAADVEPYPAVE